MPPAPPTMAGVKGTCADAEAMPILVLLSSTPPMLLVLLIGRSAGDEVPLKDEGEGVEVADDDTDAPFGLFNGFKSKLSLGLSSIGTIGIGTYYVVIPIS